MPADAGLGLSRKAPVAYAHLVAHEIARRVVRTPLQAVFCRRSEQSSIEHSSGSLFSASHSFLSEKRASPLYFVLSVGSAPRTLAKQGGRFPSNQVSSRHASAGDHHNSDTRTATIGSYRSRSMSPVVQKQEQDSFRTTFPVCNRFVEGAIDPDMRRFACTDCQKPRRAHA